MTNLHIRSEQRTFTFAFHPFNLSVMNKPHLFEQRANRSRPHSSLAHFRCVVAHELRVYQAMYQEEGQAEDPDVFLTGLSEAIGRFMGTVSDKHHPLTSSSVHTNRIHFQLITSSQHAIINL